MVLEVTKAFAPIATELEIPSEDTSARLPIAVFDEPDKLVSSLTSYSYIIRT
jgi:hypothetical protein